MASVEVLSATIAHTEEAKHEPMNNVEENTKDEVKSPPPPPPPPPSEQKQADPEAEQSADVAPEPETLAKAIEAKAILANEPMPNKKVGKASTKVAPAPAEDKTEETAKVTPQPAEDQTEETAELARESEPIVEDYKDEDEKLVQEEDKVSPQAKVEGKEE